MLNNTTKPADEFPKKEEVLMTQQMGEDFTEVRFETRFLPIYKKVKLYQSANVKDILRQLFCAHFAEKQRLWFKIKVQEREGYPITVEVYDQETDDCVYMQNPSL